MVDTDVLIDFTKGHGRELEHLFSAQESGELELYVNPVIVAEFFTDDKLKSQAKKNKALEFISLFDLVAISKKDGLLAGKLMRLRQVNFIGDALIAASCINNGFQLATRNQRHFRRIRSLKFKRPLQVLTL